jgi:hypothetical protein
MTATVNRMNGTSALLSSVLPAFLAVAVAVAVAACWRPSFRLAAVLSR